MRHKATITSGPHRSPTRRKSLIDVATKMESSSLFSSWLTTRVTAISLLLFTTYLGDSRSAAFHRNPPTQCFSSSIRSFRRTSCLRVAPDAESPARIFYSAIGRSNNYRTSTCLYSSNEPESDREEWRALLAAFQMYKAAYGDLKVPTRFIVPAMPPWPKAAWGMKLGLKVGAIRSTGKYIQNKKKRRKALESLGFVWRVRAPRSTLQRGSAVSFEQFYEALVAYRELEQPTGNLRVPTEFEVPNSAPWPETTRGLPLGVNFARVTSSAFLKDNPDVKQQLEKVGVSFEEPKKVSQHDARFQRVFAALKRYKELYGDLLVPQPFVIPEQSADWPENLWGLRLGARVNAIRSQGTFVKNDPDRRQMLDDLGFAWSPPQQQEQRRRGRRPMVEPEPEEELEEEAAEFELETDDLPEFEESGESADLAPDTLFGSFEFGQEPPESEGDEEEKVARTWGLDESGGSLDVQKARMEAMSSEESSSSYRPERTLDESLAEAKRRAQEIGVIRLVGEEERMAKGKREKSIPWFNDDFGGDFVFDDVVEALTLYKKFYGDFSNLTNSEDFVIPINGRTVNAQFGNVGVAKRQFEEDDRFGAFDDLLDDIDFGWDLEAENAVDTTVVPDAIPEVDAEWPEHLEGMALGNIVARIRDGSLEVGHLPERKKALDDLGFDWGDPKLFIDVPFEKAMCAMFGYYLVRGDMFVREDFVMPDEDPWPGALAGYELGKAVKRIRELQNFLEAFHPEKVSLLRMIDFLWFPTAALPIDPSEPEMTPEMLLLSSFGHPDYRFSQMAEWPYDLVDKIHSNGPVHDTDKTWKKYHNWDYVKDLWYKSGRRDNAFYLRAAGYPQMAAEHEAKYGPGLFQQIHETLKYLEDVGTVPENERYGLLEKLQFFRGEMEGCKDLHQYDLQQVIELLDIRILEIADMVGGAKEDLDIDYGEEYKQITETVNERGPIRSILEFGYCKEVEAMYGEVNGKIEESTAEGGGSVVNAQVEPVEDEFIEEEEYKEADMPLQDLGLDA